MTPLLFSSGSYNRLQSPLPMDSNVGCCQQFNYICKSEKTETISISDPVTSNKDGWKSLLAVRRNKIHRLDPCAVYIDPVAMVGFWIWSR